MYQHVNIRIYTTHPHDTDLIVVRNQEYIPYTVVDVRWLFKALYHQIETIREIKVEAKEGGLYVEVRVSESWRPATFGLRKNVHRIREGGFVELEDRMSALSKYRYRAALEKLQMR